MPRVINGDRIGKQARLAVGCSATIFDSARQKVLLTRRMDNGTCWMWADWLMRRAAEHAVHQKLP
jgi:hypothetical protein